MGNTQTIDVGAGADVDDIVLHFPNVMGNVGLTAKRLCASWSGAGIPCGACTYRYGWEDAGSSKQRFGDYLFHLPKPGSPPE